MNQVVAKRLLLEVADVLDGLDLPFFLSHGTALGAYRDGGFTPQEDDVDVGFLAEHFVPLAPCLACELTRLGYEVCTLVRPFQRCWAVKARKHGVGMDLACFVRWTDQVYGDDGRFMPSTLADFCGYYPTPTFEITEPVTVFGREFRVPSPARKYLALEYGEGWSHPSRLHAYTTLSRTRVDGFLSSRGVPATLLNGL